MAWCSYGVLDFKYYCDLRTTTATAVRLTRQVAMDLIVRSMVGRQYFQSFNKLITGWHPQGHLHTTYVRSDCDLCCFGCLHFLDFVVDSRCSRPRCALVGGTDDIRSICNGWQHASVFSDTGIVQSTLRRCPTWGVLKSRLLASRFCGLYSIAAGRLELVERPRLAL